MRARSIILVVLLLAVAGGFAYWYLQQERASKQSLPAAESHDSIPPEASGPRFPLPVEPLADRPNVQPLPGLDDSDEYLRLDVSRVFSPEVAALLVNQALIERIVATVDNLPRPRIAERIRPVKPLDSDFAALGQDDSGEFILGIDNYQRYDKVVAQLGSVDIDAMIDLYRRYYPLFQKAYEGLGYPDAYFNDRLIEVLDHLLATPDPGAEVVLLRPKVFYEFADKQLESLSSGQKLLIRIGPAHRETVLGTIRTFRDRVAFADE